MHPLNSHAALIDIILFGLKADSFYVHLVFLLLLRATERDASRLTVAFQYNS